MAPTLNFQTKTIESQIPTVSGDSTDCEKLEEDKLPTQNIPALPNYENKQQAMLQAEDDAKRSQGTSRAKSDSFTDFDATQDTNKDQREKSNVSLVVASNTDNEVALCSDGNGKNEQDIPTQIIPALHEKNVNVDNDVTDCELAAINTNKPPPFVNTAVDNVASESVPIRIKELEGVVLNNINNVKKTFDEVVSQFTIALQSSIRVKSEPNIIPSDKADKIKPIDVANNYFDATQDINNDQREKSNVSLVLASNADDVVLCSVDGNVKNEQDENKNIYYGIDLPSQENMGNVSTNDATLTYVSDSSDEESTQENSKRFTFTDSDFPDSDEIRDILMSYPKPVVIDSFTESESEYSSEDESYKFLRRFRNKTKPVPKVDLTKMFEILPERVLMRQRKPREVNSKNNSTILKPRYLTEQEDQIDEEIVLENIKRVKAFKKAKTDKDSKNHESIKKEKNEIKTRKKPDNKSNGHKREVKKKKPEKKGKHSKTKSFARKNPKEERINSVSASKTTTRRTRSKKKENDGKHTQKKCSGNKNKKPDHKRKPYEGRRSNRQQKANEKSDDTMKAPTSIHKKSKPKQSNVFNVTSSSSESPKSLKRSLIDDSDMPSSKRTRSHNNNNSNNKLLRATPTGAVKTQHVHLSAFPGKEHKLDKLDPYVRLERYEPVEKLIRTLNSNRNNLTRSQLARKRFYRSCKRTREAARTSIKRL